MVEICEMLIEIKSIGNESWPGGTYIFFAYCDLHGNNVKAHLDELETRIDKKYCEEPKRWYNPDHTLLTWLWIWKIQRHNENCYFSRRKMAFDDIFIDSLLSDDGVNIWKSFEKIYRMSGTRVYFW